MVQWRRENQPVWCSGGEKENMWGNVKEEEVIGKKKTCCALWAAAHDADNACGAPLAPAMSAVQHLPPFMSTRLFFSLKTNAGLELKSYYWAF
jgi:hypothetical protein